MSQRPTNRRIVAKKLAKGQKIGLNDEESLVFYYCFLESLSRLESLESSRVDTAAYDREPDLMI